jgi:hypothetical protein
MKMRLTAVSLALLGAGLLASPGALAQGTWGWRYNAPGQYYWQDKQLDRATVEKNAKAALSAATKGEAWKSPRGVSHIPILNKDKLAIGNLWEDADLKAVEVGTYWTGRYGTRVDLVANGKVVGVLALR